MSDTDDAPSEDDAGTGRPARGEGRHALVVAAAEVVGESGLENATLRRIAARAGVDNTLITHYFGSRDALLAEAAAWAFAEELRAAEISIDFVLDDEARDTLIDVVETSPASQLFSYEMTLAARRNPEAYGGIRELYDEYLQGMRASLRARGLPDDEPFARTVFALVDGLVLQQLSIASRTEIVAAYEAFRAVLLAARDGLASGA